MTASESSRRVGYGALLRGNANFRWLWSGQIISLLGDWFNLVASATLLAQLTDTGMALGALFIVRMLAPFVVTPFAGVWADRYNRKMLLIGSDLVRAVTVLGMLTIHDAGDVWLLYALTGIQLGLSGVFFPTRTAILPDLVSPSELGAANALSSSTWSLMLAVGAALGGLTTGWVGIHAAFAVDAATFLCSALLIGQIAYGRHHPAATSSSSWRDGVRQYVDGLRFLRGHGDISVQACLKGALALTMAGPFQVAQVIIAERYFPIGEGGSLSLGILYAVVGAGTGIGPIAARAFTGDRDRPLRWSISLAFLVGAGGLALMTPLHVFGVVLFGTFLRGMGAGTNWVFSTQLLFHRVPEHVRGRVFATEFAVLTLLSAIGTAWASWWLDHVSSDISTLLWIMVAATLVAGASWTLWVVTRKNGGSA